MNKDRKQVFNELLRSTGREGVENVISNLEALGFYEAPASAGHHLNEPEGLLEHSLNVCSVATQIAPVLMGMKIGLNERLPEESIILATLLHDVCKAEIYKPAIKKRKTPMGYWQEYNGYDVSYNEFPMGHGEKSVIRLLQWGLKMTDDEMMAIRWHMGAWDLAFQSYEAKECLNIASTKCPLLKLLQASDGLAAGILEV